MSDFKQRGRDWNAARKAEQRQRDDAAKATREKRYQQNLTLKHHGYTWSKIQDIGGPSDDGDHADMVWQLYAADGRAVTIAEALKEIADAG